MWNRLSARCQNGFNKKKTQQQQHKVCLHAYVLMHTFWLHKVSNICLSLSHECMKFTFECLDSQLASYWKSKTDREGHRVLRRKKKWRENFFNYFCALAAASRSFLRWRLTQTTCPLHINTKSSQQQVAVSHPVKAIAETQNALLQHIFPKAPQYKPKMVKWNW